MLAALTNYPSYYYAGAVGTDGFPDPTYGQGVIGATDTGVWVQRMLDMAWAAQKDPSYTPQEQLQILAFAYGYATNAASNTFYQTLVNEFSGGAGNNTDLASTVRQILVEGYVADATPGFDADASRTVLPDGDVSDTATPGITLDVPTRFVYETLITPFPGDPTAAADTGRTTLSVNLATNSFERTSGSFLDDHFAVGQQIYGFGFNNNNGKYTVTAVTALTLTVQETLTAGDATGTGDEALVTQGSRGALLDQFLSLQRTLDTQADLATTAYQALYGVAPSTNFNAVLANLTAQLPTPPSPQQSAELYIAYLRNWSSQIDAGLQDWADVGLASAARSSTRSRSATCRTRPRRPPATTWIPRAATWRTGWASSTRW